MKRALSIAVLAAGLAAGACDRGPEQPTPLSDGFGTALLRVAIPVRDIEASKRFYSHALGFQPGFEGDITSPWVSELLQLEDGQTVQFVVLYGADAAAGDGTNSAMIGLLEVSNPPVPELRRPASSSLVSGEGMLAMVTSDIQTVHERLQELGATILFGPSPSVDGSESEIVFRDPDGMRVHVVERHR